IENQQHQKQIIHNNIVKCQQNFTDNTTKMIDSILKRQSQYVQSINIITPSTVITEPKEIKKAISKYFET
ncbi:6224_t:CDS:1, partial [Dentiscutata heterogama]